MVDCGELEDLTLRIVKGMKVCFNPYQARLDQLMNAKGESANSLKFYRSNLNFLIDDDMGFIREVSDLNLYLIAQYRSLLLKDHEVKKQFYKNSVFYRGV